MGEINLFRRIRTADRSLEKVQDGIAILASQARKAINDLKTSITTTALTATTATITTLNGTTVNATTKVDTASTEAEMTVSVADLDDAITSGGTVDVTGVSTLFCNTTSSYTINNFTGGVNGQILYIIKTNNSNNLTLTHSSGSNQPMLFPGGAAKVLTANLGGLVLKAVYDSGSGITYWFGLDA